MLTLRKSTLKLPSEAIRMRYISTHGKSTADLRGAVAQCFAPDGGLYMPENIPLLPKAFFNNIEEMNVREIAYVVVTTLLGADFDAAGLKAVVDATFSVPMPVKDLRDGLSVLELHGGPTLAFKDFGARFLAELITRFPVNDGQRHIDLVATTGNTGAAIANAFAQKKNHDVVVLFPRGALTRSQQAQFTTLGPNIHAVEVGGTISQCKRLVVEAVSDSELSSLFVPVCVNTSNILRLLPQVVFFFHIYSRLKASGTHAENFNVAVPCGNLSNLVAAVMAKRMGLPIGKIVAACTANDDFVRVMAGDLAPDKVNVNSRHTLAWAMDSGYPTNLWRVLSLYGGDIEAARRDIAAISVSDDEIAGAITRELELSGYMADPHTAVALAAIDEAALPAGSHNVALSTAHPAKSLDTMTAITGRAIELPLQLTRFMTKGVVPAKLPPTYAALKKYLMKL